MFFDDFATGQSLLFSSLFVDALGLSTANAIVFDEANQVSILAPDGEVKSSFFPLLLQ